MNQPYLNYKRNKANFELNFELLSVEMVQLQNAALSLMKFNIRVLTKNIYSNNCSYDEQFQF